MILNDKRIRELSSEHGMIEPFEDGQVEKGVISYGLSSYGYDIRLSDEFKIFSNVHTGTIGCVDPKRFNKDAFIDVAGGFCIIPPNSFALARSLEYIRVPRECLVLCLGKSTYARCGIIVNVTPLEPEWEGFITIEISNTTPLPCKVYANEGIAQLIFFHSPEGCLRSYADKKGKYQKQKGIEMPRVKCRGTD